MICTGLEILHSLHKTGQNYNQVRVDCFFFCKYITFIASQRQNLAPLPYKFFADRAEGGLVEEGGCELVVPDDMNLRLFESSSPPVEGSDSILWHHFHRLLTRSCGEE